MRGKRAKQSKKLMHAFQNTFGFREPYQVLLDHRILQDAARFKIDLVGRLKKMLQAGEIKPMITQCDMRHLYDATPKDEALISQAKTYERRRCGHHELETPLSSLECISECVDPKRSLTNKFRYIVASQDPAVRAHLRTIPGVPLIYISKSVVILEPMATATELHRDREEKAKFKAGLKGRRGADENQKRKREDEDEEDTLAQDDGDIGQHSIREGSRPQKKKRTKGPKQPNPLSMKKPKPRDALSVTATARPTTSRSLQPSAEMDALLAEEAEAGKRKRRRKHKSKGDGGTDAPIDADTSIS